MRPLYRMSSTLLLRAGRSFNIILQLSAISSTGCLETTCGVQTGVIRVQGPPAVRQLHRIPCRHLSTRVNEFHATPSSLGRSRGSCGAAMQNNKIRKAKFSRVCSINLELTTDDRSRRFYFNEQFQWTFES